MAFIKIKMYDIPKSRNTLMGTQEDSLRMVEYVQKKKIREHTRNTGVGSLEKRETIQLSA